MSTPARADGAEVVDLPGAKPREINLDAARKARAEARGDQAPPVVVVGGENIALPMELPSGALAAFGTLFAVAEVAGSEDPTPEAMARNLAALAGLEEAAESLFGEAWQRIKATPGGLSFEDVQYLLESALDVYGVSLPESGASGGSS